MHDVGTFVWVVLVVIGVVSSIVSNARKRAGASPDPVPSQPMPSRQPSPYMVSPQAMPAPAAAPPAPPRVVRVRQPAPPPQPPQPAAHDLDVFRPARRHGPRLFAGRGALVRAVIGAEVLGKPLALRDE